MEGTHVYLWPIHIDVWQKSSQYYKVIILQVNKHIHLKFLNKKKKKKKTVVLEDQIVAAMLVLKGWRNS